MRAVAAYQRRALPMTIRFVFPSSALNPREPDEVFAEQVAAFRAGGFATSLFATEALATDAPRFKPTLNIGDTLVYRGWMLSEREYSSLESAVTAAGASLLTSLESYLATHHLPRWYPLLKEWTPKTVVFSPNANLVEELRALGWERYFIKDYVKSLKTSVGSLIDRPETAALVAQEMARFRTTIEGGFCVRKVELFVEQSETRYFVIHGKPYAPTEEMSIPAIVDEVTSRIRRPFFSVDIAMRSDGQLRVVEIGDGQVSDIVGWSPERLVDICKRLSTDL